MIEKKRKLCLTPKFTVVYNEIANRTRSEVNNIFKYNEREKVINANENTSAVLIWFWLCAINV